MSTEMDAQTLEALKASIAKWERNAEVADVQDAKIFSSSCPLCALFCMGDEYEWCRGCPVMDRTGETLCGSTPWGRANYYFGKSDLTNFQAAAREEVAFLKSLLPEAAEGRTPTST